MADKNERREDRRDEEGNGEKLDLLLNHLDGIGERLDAIHKRLDEQDKRLDAVDAAKDVKKDAKVEDENDRKDAESERERSEAAKEGHREDRKDEDEEDRAKAEEKAKRDEDEEEEEKEEEKDREDEDDLPGDPALSFADAEDEEERSRAAKKGHEDEDSRHDAQISDLRAQLAAVRAKLPKPMTDSDYDQVSASQARADAIYNEFGKRAPRPLSGEGNFAYVRRVLNDLKKHSTTWKDMDLSVFTKMSQLAKIEKQVFADAQAAARSPTAIPDGVLLPIRKRGSGGHNITEFHGEPKTWLSAFRGGAVKRLRNFGSTQNGR